jgi:hypothetical protein
MFEEAQYMLRRGRLEEVARVVSEYNSGGGIVSSSISSDQKFAHMEEILIRQGVSVKSRLSVFSPRPSEGKMIGGGEVVPGEMSVHTSSLEEFISRAEPLMAASEEDDDAKKRGEGGAGDARSSGEKKNIAFGSGMGVRSGKRPILVSGQTLPSGRGARVSCLTQLPISGCLVGLEDRISWMTMSEALEYCECSSFSPLLTGHKLPLL